MTCAEIESLICEYVDGELDSAQRAEVERHLDGCPACAELALDSAAAVSFMERAADVEAPPELITRILYDAPWTKSKWGLPKAGWLGRIFRPLVQPKYVMSAAMTILSFSMLSRYTPMRQVKASDLSPSAVWATIDDNAHRAWARTVKYYDNLKVVYEIQTMLREWQAEKDEQKPAAPVQPKVPERQLPIKGTAGSPGGQTRNSQ